MLRRLAVRDLVLIDRLDLDFGPGLTALTGETGAGKSILLDALGLALGHRAEAGLVRAGCERAQVTATFDIPADHPARRTAAESGLDSDEDEMILRRTLGADGRSRAQVNDQPASVQTLRRIGAQLVEIEGQFSQTGLLDAGTHRTLLDSFAGHQDLLTRVAGCWHAWQAKAEEREAARARLAQDHDDEPTLRARLNELDALAPEDGEASRLDAQRALLAESARLLETLNAAYQELESAAPALARAERGLDRLPETLATHTAEILEQLSESSSRLADATAAIERLSSEVDVEPGHLDMVTDRLYALRELARQLDVDPDALPPLREDLSARLDALADAERAIADMDQLVAETREQFHRACRQLTDSRTEAAAALDAAVGRELPPLRLDKADFRTTLVPLDEEGWTVQGAERVRFDVATNPGASPGPLGKVASGGELARFLLAIKVALLARDDATGQGPGTLVFDEVDAGVGGATAEAVGARLARLGERRQILVVTHSPQVAARAARQWRITKSDATPPVTHVQQLDADDRREELARMLSGATVTDAARAAADSLLQDRP